MNNTNDQYDNVNETINHDKVNTEETVVNTGNVAADDAATAAPDAGLGTASGSGTGLGTAPEATARVNPATQHFNPESEKQKGREDVLNLFAKKGNAAKSQTSIEFHAHVDIDPEDPDTVPDEV